MRLIDADALLEGREDHEMISTHLIWNAPTIDAVPVERCKECKHLFDGEHNANCCAVLMEKAKWLTEITVDEHWYCGWGERKSEDPSHPCADSVMMGD